MTNTTTSPTTQDTVGRETVRLTADVVLLTPSRHVLLIQRGWDPYKGYWALPGGHVDPGEKTVAAAHRELAEETGLVVESLDLVGVYADPGRDPRGRYVTFAYVGVGDVRYVLTAGDDAVDALWWPLEKLVRHAIAFDHYRIIEDAVRVWSGSGLVTG
jgi:8-oxo-dGTP diphosphatase